MDHKKVHKQGEDAGNLLILLHLRSLFWLLQLKKLAVKLVNAVTCYQNRDLRICKLSLSSSCVGMYMWSHNLKSHDLIDATTKLQLDNSSVICVGNRSDPCGSWWACWGSGYTDIQKSFKSKLQLKSIRNLFVQVCNLAIRRTGAKASCLL